MITSKLDELHARWSALKHLATRLSGDERRMSTPLDANDDLARSAMRCRVHLVTPLTIGTLLASVLSEIDGVELAMEGIRRNERPGEDVRDPLAQWQPPTAPDTRTAAQRNAMR